MHAYLWKINSNFTILIFKFGSIYCLKLKLMLFLLFLLFLLILIGNVVFLVNHNFILIALGSL